MTRVLLVEDEPPILRALRGMIERTDATFRVVATAGDGEMALEILQKESVDVVFTDIRMPVMDGLRLMERLHADYPQILVVVLSGYQDFAYVSHAIRMRAFDYLLKPLSPEILTPLLARIRETLGQRRRERLRQLLAERMNRAPVRRAVPATEADERLGVLLLCAGALPMTESAELLPGAAYWNGLALDALAEEALGELSPFTWVFMGDTPSERVAVFEPADGEDCRQMGEYLYECVTQGAEVPVTAACAARAVPLSDVGETLKRLKATLKEGLVVGQGLFLVEGEERPAALVDAELLRRAAGAAARGEEKAREEIARLLASLREAPQAVAAEALLSLVPAEAAGLREAIREAVGAATDMDGLASDVCALLLEDGRCPPRANVAREIEKYLQTQYMRHITNQTLAQEFGYVPGYLSLIFRRETGVSPSEYLTRVRLDNAKRILRSEPDVLVKDVAERVGFKNPYHFSKIFKKYEGVWPTNYKP